EAVQSSFQRRVDDVRGYCMRRVIGEHISLPGGSDRLKPRLVGKAPANSGRQSRILDVIIDCVLAVAQRAITLDTLPVDDGNGATCQCLIVAEAVPSESLGRPDQPGARTTLVELGRRKDAVWNVDRYATVAQRRQFLEPLCPNGRRTHDRSSEKYVQGPFPRPRWQELVT